MTQSTTTQPLVTIGMPIYNAGRSLLPAVQSIVRQSYENWELLIIDDGSTDDALATIDHIKDARITIFRDGRNHGLAARLNEAIDRGRGKFFARMDQDDISFPERIERQVRFLEEKADIDLVSVRTVKIAEDDREIGMVPFRQTHEELCAAPWRGFYMVHPSWMGRMEWFRKHRYAEPAPLLCEDQELLLRSYSSSRFAAIPDLLFAYRRVRYPSLARLLSIRLSVVRMQLRHFRATREWGFACLAIITCALRLGSDLCRLPVRIFSGRFTRPLSRRICPVSYSDSDVIT